MMYCSPDSSAKTLVFSDVHRLRN